MELGEMVEGTPSEFTLNVNAIKLPPELFADDAQSKAMLDALGYTSGFTLNVEVDGGYDRGTDAMSVDTFAIDAVDVGKLSISSKLTGIPLSKAGDPGGEWMKTGKLESFSLALRQYRHRRPRPRDAGQGGTAGDDPR